MINFTREKKILLIGWLRYAVAAFLFVCFAIFLFLQEELPVPESVKVEIDTGSTLGDISQELKSKGLIGSESLFNFYALITGNTETLKSGIYLFESSHSIPEILERLVEHDTQQKRIEVTLPEGFTREEMATELEAYIQGFDRYIFLENTTEGYLFPDTYRFFEAASEEQVINELKENHDDVASKLLEEYDLPEGFTQDEWVILASIIEKEANTADSRRRVADILLRRLEEGMALQVDATFVYGVQKDSFTLTTEDLRQDHEYNTYTRVGLPPTAISNPGEDALLSVLDPIPNTAVYFLTGLDGVMYYADTYAGHRRNRRLYLNK